MNEVALCIQSKDAVSRNQVAVRRLLLRGAMLVERGPRAQVVPSEIRGDAEQTRCFLALLGAWLKHGVVDADVLAPGIQFAQGRGKVPRSERCRNLLKNSRGRGQMFVQGVCQGPCAPQKHSAVPEVIACSQELRRPASVGFLSEAPDAQNISVECGACLDIAVASFRPGGVNSEDHDVLPRNREVNPPGQDLTESLLVRDHVIGRKQADDGVGIASPEDERRQPDGGRGIASDGLCDDLLFAQTGQLPSYLALQVLVGNHPEISGSCQGKKPPHGLLDHGALAIHHQQLLGPAFPTERPKARAAATSKNYGIEMCCLFRHECHGPQSRPQKLHSSHWL